MNSDISAPTFVLFMVFIAACVWGYLRHLAFVFVQVFIEPGLTFQEGVIAVVGTLMAPLGVLHGLALTFGFGW